MTFPRINYKFNGNDEAKALAVLVDQKFSALEKYCSPHVRSVCDVEFEKTTGHQRGRIYRVEANLTIDGSLYRAEATEENFEKAIDEVRDELDKELRHAKDKEHTRRVEAGREFKDLLTGE